MQKRMLLALALCLSLILGACAAPAPAPAPETQPAAAQVSPAPPDEPAPAPTQQPSAPELYNPYQVTFLGEDTAPAEEAGGVGPEEAVQIVKDAYGEEMGGRPQSYTCEGIAEYQGETYYAINWTQLVEDAEGAHNSYMGHMYVSLDGMKVLEGDAESIYAETGG